MPRLNVPPVTTLDAQQLALPLGPHVAARPIQEGGGGGPQTFVVVLQLGVVPLQSLSDRHPTHCDVVPKFLHFGVPVPHAAQAAPQLASALQTEHTPAPAQALFVPHPISVGV
ncbi:MAG TPA: hypothetical protein VIK01_17220 [Polyangiaceae bacterium]